MIFNKVRLLTGFKNLLHIEIHAENYCRLKCQASKMRLILLRAANA
jgi:hypothetical protein